MDYTLSLVAETKECKNNGLYTQFSGSDNLFKNAEGKELPKEHFSVDDAMFFLTFFPFLLKGPWGPCAPAAP